MREEFRVAREAVAAEEERALVYRRGRDGVHRPGGAQLDRRLDVLGGCAPRRARLDAGLDRRADVVEVVDDWGVRRGGERLAAPDDRIAAAKVQCARRVREQLRVADDEGRATLKDFAFGDGLEDDLGADAGGVAHRDGDARAALAPADARGWLW